MELNKSNIKTDPYEESFAQGSINWLDIEEMTYHLDKELYERLQRELELGDDYLYQDLVKCRTIAIALVRYATYTLRKDHNNAGIIRLNPLTGREVTLGSISLNVNEVFGNTTGVVGREHFVAAGTINMYKLVDHRPLRE